MAHNDVCRLVHEVDLQAKRTAEVDEAKGLQEVRAWIARSSEENETLGMHRIVGKAPAKPNWRDRTTARMRWLLTKRRDLEVPRNAVYLNVAPHGTPAPHSFKWLHGRPDVKPVFFVHDLLPIDRPEFFPRSWQSSFERMVTVVTSRAAGIIVASEVMKSRATEVREAR